MIKLEMLQKTHCGALSEILSMDEQLHRLLSKKTLMPKVTAEECYQECKAWEQRKSGKCFAICHDGITIGMISYTQNQDGLSCGCGYWIGSDYWNCGYMTETFRKFLILIKNRDFRMVTAKIIKGNTASIKIWKRYHAVITEDEEYYYPKLSIE